MHRNAELSRTSNYTTQRPNDPTTRINGQTRLHFRWWLGPRPARPPAKRQTVLWALPCIWRSSAVSRLAELQRKCQVNRYISSSKCYDTTLLGLYFVHLCTLFSRTTNFGIVSCALFSWSHDGSPLRSISLFFLKNMQISNMFKYHKYHLIIAYSTFRFEHDCTIWFYVWCCPSCLVTGSFEFGLNHHRQHPNHVHCTDGHGPSKRIRDSRQVTYDFCAPLSDVIGPWKVTKTISKRGNEQWSDEWYKWYTSTVLVYII